MPEFDRSFWEHHWDPAASGGERRLPANPYVQAETAHLSPGTALDAGCGTGAEALWLAEQGWEVTAADISSSALATARARAATVDAGARIDWVEADLSRWEPDRSWDLVATSYAHSEIGQLPFYRRIASWVAPGGTLLIVGHCHDRSHGDSHDHGHADSHDRGRGDHPGHPDEGLPDHPESASVTAEAITRMLDTPSWQIDAAYESTRTVHPGGRPVPLHDVIVRARRIARPA